MIFIKRRNSEFSKMICPEVIDVSTKNDCILFVVDRFGVTYYLIFQNHAELSASMSQLSEYGRCRCIVEDYGICYEQTQTIQHDDEHDRQLEYNDIEMEIER